MIDTVDIHPSIREFFQKKCNGEIKNYSRYWYVLNSLGQRTYIAIVEQSKVRYSLTEFDGKTLYSEEEMLKLIKMKSFL